MDLSFCNFIAEIQKDPFKKIENLSVGQFYKLQEHLKTCPACDTIVGEIIEKHKDVPDNPNSDWNKADYN